MANSFVSDAYTTLLGRAGRPDEIKWWEDEVAAGRMDQQHVMASIKNSPEYKNKMPVPANPANANETSVSNYGSSLVNNPGRMLGEETQLQKNVPDIDPNTQGTNVNWNDPRFSFTSQKDIQAAQAALTDPRQAQTYQAKTTQQNIMQNGQMTAAQGKLSDGSIIDPNEVPQLDMQGTATGTNADGSTNYTGKALNDYARQDISTIIDTSTASGKALAQMLGEGNYTDSKATLKGQLETLQSEFVDKDGNPKIPMWAAGVARSVGKIAAFKGMTGTAATAAMSQALMEASIPVAQQDAQFFQTLTLQNLSNKQSSIINKANVLAKFDLTNLDNRMAAAVENSKAFLQMDLANLDNEQQARIINTQARVQSILEDAKAINTQRMFTASESNDMDKFYDQLNANIKMYNTTQTNDVGKFNADLENNREQFYKNMQYNIDIANAKWRQTVTLAGTEMKFQAAATDVKNMVGISQEALNRLWDRSDSLLDYLWKSTESELDRKAAMTLQTLAGEQAADIEDSKGWGAMFGSVVGAGAEAFFKDFSF